MRPNPIGGGSGRGKDARLGAFMEQRPRLLGIAYRMLGDVAEAEDIVQEAFLRFSSVPASAVESTPAFLTTVTTRLAIDRLRSARVRRETYVGEWLAEPVLHGGAGGEREPDEQAVLAESVTLGFLAMLDALSPTERAVFLLHEVFDVPFREIAPMVSRTEPACRQIASRARRELASRRAGQARVHAEVEQETLDRFVTALSAGDLQGVLESLGGEVVATSDGGGRVPAAIRPVRGAGRVARFLLGIVRRAPAGFSVEPARINGEPGFLVRDGDSLESVVVFGVGAEGIEHIHLVRNPEKLRSVGSGYRLPA